MKIHDNEFVLCHTCVPVSIRVRLAVQSSGLCVTSSLKPLESQGLFYVTGSVCATS